MPWESDLKIWRNTEIEFASILLKRGARKLEFAPDGQFQDWDIKATFILDGVEKEYTYEVKIDRKSRETPNVWFEYKCSWHVSGIFVSKADFIVYKVEDKFYCMPRPELLVRLDFVNKLKRKGWDHEESDLFIVNKSDFFAFISRNWWIWEG